MGTPAFSATILESLLAWDGCEVVGVFTQPDRPSGRGRRLCQSDVKKLALARDIPVFQPVNFKDPESVAMLRDLKPDVATVAAYGLILPKIVLEIPRCGCVNVHASLLPKYRGAAPIQRAILDGERVTGVTIMQMNEGLDTGDMMLQRAVGIGIDDTAASLHDQLAAEGGELLVDALKRVADNTMAPIPQNDALSSYAAKLDKEEGRIDWNQPCWDAHNRIRAMHPWPGAFFFLDAGEGGKPFRVSIFPGEAGDALEGDVKPGTLLGLQDGKLAIACADKAYLVPMLRPECKKAMDAKSFYNGYLTRQDLLCE